MTENWTGVHMPVKETILYLMQFYDQTTMVISESKLGWSCAFVSAEAWRQSWERWESCCRSDNWEKTPVKAFNICLCVHRGGRYDLILHLKYDIIQYKKLHRLIWLHGCNFFQHQSSSCEGCQWIFLLLTILLIFIHLSMSLFGWKYQYCIGTHYFGGLNYITIEYYKKKLQRCSL